MHLILPHFRPQCVISPGMISHSAAVHHRQASFVPSRMHGLRSLSDRVYYPTPPATYRTISPPIAQKARPTLSRDLPGYHPSVAHVCRLKPNLLEKTPHDQRRDKKTGGLQKSDGVRLLAKKNIGWDKTAYRGKNNDCLLLFLEKVGGYLGVPCFTTTAVCQF